jgi:hypothetical protein
MIEKFSKKPHLKFLKNRKAAFEMSVSTIVTIVLSVTLLVLGIFFVQSIFKSAKGVVDLTDQQLRNEINKLFSEENEVSIYPGTRLVEIKQETTDGVGIGIKNLGRGVSGATTFSYNIFVSDSNIQEKCGISAETAEDWIVTGKAEEGIAIPAGDFSAQKVLFEIPVGAPLCTIRFRVNVNAESATGVYGQDFFDLRIRAK